MLGFWFIGQFFNGLLSLAFVNAAYTGGVAWWAHVGGFVAGMVLGAILQQRRREPRWPVYPYYYR